MNAPEKKPAIRLTANRTRILQGAAAHPLGLTNRPHMTGFERVSWDRNADALVKAGYLAPYVHGDFEITDAGRAAIADAMLAERERQS